MQAFFVVLNQPEHLEPLLQKMLESGITGSTVLDSRGMARVLCDEDTPIFGMLRNIVNQSRAENKTLFTVLRDEQVDTMRALVNEVTGGIAVPGTGIMFAVPISFVEGMMGSK